jgi:hypothetical protein
MAQTPKLVGDYSGMLGPLHLKLHLKTPATGAIEGTLDSVDQGAMVSGTEQSPTTAPRSPEAGRKARKYRWSSTAISHSQRPKSRPRSTASGWARSRRAAPTCGSRLR